MLLLYLAIWNALLAFTQQHQKGTTFHTKNRRLLVHIVELSTALRKLIQKLLMLVWLKLNVYIVYRRPQRKLRYRDRVTPLNWTMTAWSSWARSTTKQNRIYQFFRKRFNQRRLQFMFTYSFSNWLAVSCFSFWKAFVKCPSSSVSGIFDDVRCMTSSPRNDVTVLS